MGTPRFHTSVVRIAAESNFRLSEDELGSLVTTRNKAGTVTDGLTDTFMGHVVVTAQDLRSSVSDDLAAVKAASKQIMPVVNRFAFTDDIKANPADSDSERERKMQERQRRTGWARSSFSALSRWLKNGGKLSEVDPAAVKKSRLEAEARKAEGEAAAEAGENTPEVKAQKRATALITALNQVEDSGKRIALRDAILRMIEEGVKA